MTTYQRRKKANDKEINENTMALKKAAKVFLKEQEKLNTILQGKTKQNIK